MQNRKKGAFEAQKRDGGRDLAMKSMIYSKEAELSAAKLIVETFDGIRVFSFMSKTNVVDVWNALMVARACCGSDEFGKCLKWAKDTVKIMKK